MNAIEFLIKEHEKVRAMLVEINERSDDYKTQLKFFDKLCDDLLRHEAMEHKVWYPYFKNDPRISSKINYLLKEENDAEKAINKLNHIQDKQEWQEKYKKFQSDVLHHANEEEQQLFPEVQKILSDSILVKIGKEMKEFTEKYNNVAV